MPIDPSGLDRRTLIKTSAATAALLATSRFANAQGSDTIRVGVIGCGGRGTGAAFNCVASSPGVEIESPGPAGVGASAGPWFAKK